ncbi:MAG TPA: hypothetical protein VME86_13850 [Acidobacteriaceae bacterium]|nr:hypothetical protein [Acidobacteriaceae bacterium]
MIGADSMTNVHFANFIVAVQRGRKLDAPISMGNAAVTMVQFSNIPWEVQRHLRLRAGGSWKIRRL